MPLFRHISTGRTPARAAARKPSSWPARQARSPRRGAGAFIFPREGARRRSPENYHRYREEEADHRCRVHITLPMPRRRRHVSGHCLDFDITRALQPFYATAFSSASTYRHERRRALVSPHKHSLLLGDMPPRQRVADFITGLLKVPAPRRILCGRARRAGWPPSFHHLIYAAR